MFPCVSSRRNLHLQNTKTQQPFCRGADLRRFVYVTYSVILTTAALALLLAGLSSPALAANTIHVPADQPTIQAGINVAKNGDTVLVSPGTYYENINFLGKRITVKSASWPAGPILC